MSMALLGLLAGFVLVLVVLSMMLFMSTYPVFVKGLVVIVVTAFYWVQYESLLLYTGWPSVDNLPVKFVLIAADVQEPNAQTGAEGKLFWWLRDSALPEASPRAYELPYQEELHEKSAEVLEDQKSGAQYVGKIVGSTNGGKGLGVSFEKISKSALHQKP